MTAHTYELPNAAQMQALIYQQALNNAYTQASSMGLSALERQLAAQYIGARNGKVFATKIWHFATNTSSMGVRMLDSVGLECTPATDTVAGRDDFAEESEIFTWQRCNYTRDSDGTARPTALYGAPSYRTTGAVDIGNVYPTFFYAVQDCGTYDMYYMSDSPHPELGLVPWYEAVKADGTVLPFYVHSAFYSVNNTEGGNTILRSQYGAPAYNQSYNGMITAYQKKGTGYWGAGMERNLWAYLMLVIKYNTKNSQKIFAGCTSFTDQVACALGETGVKRVLLSSQGGFYAGCCISVGSATNKDRGSTTIGDLADRVQITNIETVTINSTQYVALNLNLSKTITTTTATYVTSMPCYSGETDGVIGHFDGSIKSNTDGRHVFRIGGTEYSNGQSIIASNVVYYRDDVNAQWLQYVAMRGTKHVANAYTDYVLSGKVPALDSDYWIGDMAVNPSTGSMNVKTTGTSDILGVGDRIWGPSSGKGTQGELREAYTIGALWFGSGDGLCSGALWGDLGSATWFYGACD